MKTSIRQFLLIYLLLAVTLTTTLTAIGNYALDQKDIQEHLDSLMAISALSYQALLSDDLHQRPLAKIQRNLNLIPKKIQAYFEKNDFNRQQWRYDLNKFHFQVWTKTNHLLLHSAGDINTPISVNIDGFSDTFLNQQKWRLFTTTRAGIRTVLAERYDTRNELGQRIAQDELYILLLTFPLSGFLIWIIIGKGLSSLERVAQEVANRAPYHLEPVNIQHPPEEITPVIDELNKLFFRLKEGFEREQRFAADAAHELRTPLAAIKALAQVALNTKTIEEKNQALEKLITSVNRSTHVVQQLLTMSKLIPETANMQDQESVSLSNIARDILAMLAPTAIEKNIDLEFEADPHVPKIIGNPTALGILIRNLVDNAIRYTEPNGHVHVKVYVDKTHLILQVRDNGPGIPQALQSRVFERFFRVLGNTSPGSGLGLAIVQQIASMHHGSVMLHSPQEGSGLIAEVKFDAS